MHLYNGLSATCAYLDNNNVLPWPVLKRITLELCAQYVFDAYAKHAQEPAEHFEIGTDYAGYSKWASEWERYECKCFECTRTKLECMQQWLKIVNVLYLKYNLVYVFPVHKKSFDCWPVELFHLLACKEHPFYRDCLNNDIFMQVGDPENDIIVDVILPFHKSMDYRHYTYHDLEDGIEYSHILYKSEVRDAGWLDEESWHKAACFNRMRRVYERAINDKKNIYNIQIIIEDCDDKDYFLEAALFKNTFALVSYYDLPLSLIEYATKRYFEYARNIRRRGEFEQLVTCFIEDILF